MYDQQKNENRFIKFVIAVWIICIAFGIGKWTANKDTEKPTNDEAKYATIHTGTRGEQDVDIDYEEMNRENERLENEALEAQIEADATDDEYVNNDTQLDQELTLIENLQCAVEDGEITQDKAVEIYNEWKEDKDNPEWHNRYSKYLEY